MVSEVATAAGWADKRPDLLDEIKKVLATQYPAMAIDRSDPVVVAGLLDVPSDFFQIQLVFPADYPDTLPFVYETGGRTRLAMEKRAVPLQDLHYQENGRACLCVPYEERLFVKPHAVFATFMSDLVVPFFYSQSVYERDGVWPNGERAHGGDGIWQFYKERLGCDLDLVLACMKRLARGDRPRAHWSCPCGSGRPTGECHPQLLRGMTEVHMLVERSSISSDLKKFTAAVDMAREKPRTRPTMPWL